MSHDPGLAQDRTAADLNGVAGMYLLLATGLAYPGPGGPMGAWETPAFRLEAAARAGGLTPEWRDAGIRLLSLGDAVIARRDDAGMEHTRLFGPGRKPPVPPYETLYTAAYAPTARHSQELADIQGFYRAFGVAVTPEAADRPDHMALELEFLSLLCQKEAHAVHAGMDEAASITRDARKAFLADHVGCWAGGFAARLEQHAAIPFYQELGRTLGGFVAWEMDRLGVKPAKMAHDPAPSGDGDDRMECGACPMNGMAHSLADGESFIPRQ